MELIAEGNVATLANLGSHEGSLPEGSRGELRIFLRAGVPDVVLTSLQTQLEQRGVPLWDNIVQSNRRTVFIRFRKGFPWLAVIAAVLIGLIVLAILIVGWQLFRDASTTLGPVLPILLLAAGAYILTRSLGRKRSAA